MNILKGTGYEIVVDEDDKAIAMLITGIATITFNRLDYGGGTVVLWCNSEPVCSLDMVDEDAKAIERFLREHLSPSYSIK